MNHWDMKSTRPTFAFIRKIDSTRTCHLVIVIACLLLLFASACTDKQQYGAAPLNDKATLEKLATAYRNIAQDLPVTPTGLRPTARRKFLEQVFRQAGYDYSSTLIALAQVPAQQVTQHHIDLKQLLYLPHFDRRIKQLSDIYSQDEIAAITDIDKHIK